KPEKLARFQSHGLPSTTMVPAGVQGPAVHVIDEVDITSPMRFVNCPSERKKRANNKGSIKKTLKLPAKLFSLRTSEGVEIPLIKRILWLWGKRFGETPVVLTFSNFSKQLTKVCLNRVTNPFINLGLSQIKN